MKIYSIPGLYLSWKFTLTISFNSKQEQSNANYTFVPEFLLVFYFYIPCATEKFVGLRQY